MYYKKYRSMMSFNSATYFITFSFYVQIKADKDISNFHRLISKWRELTTKPLPTPSPLNQSFDLHFNFYLRKKGKILVCILLLLFLIILFFYHQQKFSSIELISKFVICAIKFEE